jgi:hypothetical protein
MTRSSHGLIAILADTVSSLIVSGGTPSSIVTFSHVTRDIFLLHSLVHRNHPTSSLPQTLRRSIITMTSTALIIGASQGLGASLVRHYAQKLSPSNVFATIRESAPKSDDLFPKGVNVIPNIDVSKKDCGDKVVDGLQGRAVDHVWIVAGLLKGEVSPFYLFLWSCCMKVGC